MQLNKERPIQLTSLAYNRSARVRSYVPKKNIVVLSSQVETQQII